MCAELKKTFRFIDLKKEASNSKTLLFFSPMEKKNKKYKGTHIQTPTINKIIFISTRQVTKLFQATPNIYTLCTHKKKKLHMPSNPRANRTYKHQQHACCERILELS